MNPLHLTGTKITAIFNIATLVIMSYEKYIVVNWDQLAYRVYSIKGTYITLLSVTLHIAK